MQFQIQFEETRANRYLAQQSLLLQQQSQAHVTFGSSPSRPSGAASSPLRESSPAVTESDAGTREEFKREMFPFASQLDFVRNENEALEHTRYHKGMIINEDMYAKHIMSY